MRKNLHGLKTKGIFFPVEEHGMSQSDIESNFPNLSYDLIVRMTQLRGEKERYSGLGNFDFVVF